MYILPLAVAIADMIRWSTEEHASVAVKDMANGVVHGHPEADVTCKEMVKAQQLNAARYET